MTLIELVTEFLTSKKWLTAVAGVIAAGLLRINLDIPIEDIAVVLSPVIAYILGQGWSDTGKEAIKTTQRIKNGKA